MYGSYPQNILKEKSIPYTRRMGMYVWTPVLNGQETQLQHKFSIN